MGPSVKAVLINDTRIDLHHGCTVVVEKITSLAKQAGIDLIHFSPLRENWKCSSQTIERIKEADIVIVNGEGTIHHDNPAGLNLLEVGPFARSIGRRSALINATIEGNSQSAYENLKSFDIVSVREHGSARELNQAGVACRVVPDLVACYSRNDNKQRRGILVTDSVIGEATAHLYGQLIPRGARVTPILYGRHTVRDLRRSYIRVSRSSSNNLPISRLLAARAAVSEWRNQCSNYDQFAEQISGAELLVTGRFHAMMFALVTRTPFLVLTSNTRKCGSTLTDAGVCAWRSVDNYAVSEDLLEKASSWWGDELLNLGSYLSTSRKDASTLFEDIAGLVNR